MAGLTWGVAPALLLGGALWMHFGTVRSTATLRPQAPLDHFPAEEGRAPYVLPGFQLRLEPPAPAPRYALWVSPGSKPIEPRMGLKGRLGSTEFQFEVDQFLPEALDQSQLRENPAAPENPALRVMLGIGAPAPLVGTLFAEQEAGRRRDEPGGRFSVVFRKAWSPELLTALAPRPPQGEVLRLGMLGREVDHPLALGETWDQPPFRLKVLRVFPDFVVRPNAQGLPEPASKSPLPLDPWLELTFTAPEQPERRVLLSALHPELTDALNAPNLPAGLSLRYLRLGEERQPQFVVFTQDDGQVRLVDQGLVRRAEPWVPNRPFLVAPGLSVTPLQHFRHAETVPAFVPHPDPQGVEPPALRLRVTDAHGREERVWLGGTGAEGPDTALFDGRVRVAFRMGPGMFQPLLTVLDAQGQERVRKQIGLDDPLNYAGHRFTLAPQVPAALGAVSIQLVREGGTGALLTGSLLLGLGLLWLLVLEPNRPRRGN